MRKLYSPMASASILPWVGYGVLSQQQKETLRPITLFTTLTTTFKNMAGLAKDTRCALSVFRTKMHSPNWTGSPTEGSLEVRTPPYFWEPSPGFIYSHKRGKITFKIHFSGQKVGISSGEPSSFHTGKKKLS